MIAWLLGAVLLLLLSLLCLAGVSDLLQGSGEVKSAIYSGRVSHTRFSPTRHSFTYNIFYCFIDLDELRRLFPARLWPLASRRRWALVRWDGGDHLKDRPEVAGGSMSERVRSIVQQATGERPRGPVRLLTHLSYLGYCFNPVSFYYCYNAGGQRVQAIVAEVSNTPWMEMHCYVLAPGSPGVEIVANGTAGRGNAAGAPTGAVGGGSAAAAAGAAVAGASRGGEAAAGDASTAVPPASGDGDDSSGVETLRYRFRKDFHVSPFMGMDYTYDWGFSVPPGERLVVRTSMLATQPPPPEGEGREKRRLVFDARLTLKREPFTAVSLLKHLLRYPAYTAWIQLLIHVEAFRLWTKKVQFHPHPQGAETWSSRAVAAAMTPLWKLREWRRA